MCKDNKRLLCHRRHVIYYMKHRNRLDDREKNLVYHARFRHLLTLIHIEINHQCLSGQVQNINSRFIYHLERQ